MYDMKTWEMFIIFSLLIYGFEVFSRQNRDYAKVMVISFLISNVINLENIVKYFSTNFIEVILFEVAVAVATVIIMKISQSFSTMNMKFILFIIEVIAALGLCFIYYYAGAYLVSLIN